MIVEESIQRRPVGLADALRVRPGILAGLNFSDLVSAHVESLNMFLALRLERQSSALVAITGVNQNVSLVVPDGETWVMMSLAALSVTNAADQSMSVTLQLADYQGRAASIGPIMSAGNSERLEAGLLFPQVLALTSGAQLRVHSTAFVGGVGGSINLMLEGLAYVIET